MTNLDRLDILAIAKRLGFHGINGCCGSAALAINEVLFDNKGQIVMAANSTILHRNEDFVGHVGVMDEEGVIWDSETVYVGKEGIEDFIGWAVVDPKDDRYNLVECEASNVDIFVLNSMEEARNTINACPHADLVEILRTAKKTHFSDRN
jgi:hypothetical protein